MVLRSSRIRSTMRCDDTRNSDADRFTIGSDFRLQGFVSFVSCESCSGIAAAHRRGGERRVPNDQPVRYSALAAHVVPYDVPNVPMFALLRHRGTGVDPISWTPHSP